MIVLRNPILYLPCLHLTLRRYTVILSHLQALRCKAKLLGFPHLQMCHITVTLLTRVHRLLVSPPSVANTSRTVVLAANQHLIARLVSDTIRNSRQQIADFPKAYPPFQGPKTTDQDQDIAHPTTN